MKNYNFLSVILFISILLISCEDKLNEIEQELYNKVIGRWEIVSYTVPASYINPSFSFHISDSSSHKDYIKAINFNEDGYMYEILSGPLLTGLQHSWEIHDNSLWVEYFSFSPDPTEIYKLTKTEFHFKILYPFHEDDQRFFEFELKR